MSTSAVERGIQPFESVRAKTITSLPKRGRFSLTNIIARGAGSVGLFLATACGSPARSENIQVRPTATAVSIGAEFVPTGNEEIDNIQKRLMDPTAKGQVSEEDILKFNEAIANRGKAAATDEAQKSSTPDVKVGNGAIMPEELSTTGVMREFEYQGQVYKLALYNLLDGTPITAPKDDYFVAREKAGTPFIGSSLSVFNPVDLTVPNIGLRGSLQVVNRLSRNVKAGEIVAYIQDTGEKMFGEYNFGVIITSQNSTGTGFFSPEDPYKEYLPDLPKGPRIVQTQPIQSSSGNVYLPKEK